MPSGNPPTPITNHDYSAHHPLRDEKTNYKTTIFRTQTCTQSQEAGRSKTHAATPTTLHPCKDSHNSDSDTNTLPSAIHMRDKEAANPPHVSEEASQEKHQDLNPNHPDTLTVSASLRVLTVSADVPKSSRIITTINITMGVSVTMGGPGETTLRL